MIEGGLGRLIYHGDIFYNGFFHMGGKNEIGNQARDCCKEREETDHVDL